MHRLTGLVTVTVGLTATAAGVGNGPASQIAQTGELLGEFGSARFQILDGVGHQGGLHYPSVLHTQGLRAQKKKTALRATSVSHTPSCARSEAATIESIPWKSASWAGSA